MAIFLQGQVWVVGKDRCETLCPIRPEPLDAQVIQQWRSKCQQQQFPPILKRGLAEGVLIFHRLDSTEVLSPFRSKFVVPCQEKSKTKLNYPLTEPIQPRINKMNYWIESSGNSIYPIILMYTLKISWLSSFYRWSYRIDNILFIPCFWIQIYTSFMVFFNKQVSNNPGRYSFQRRLFVRWSGSG